MTVQTINRYFLLACAPFIGMLIWMFTANFAVFVPELEISAPSPYSNKQTVAVIGQNLDKAKSSVSLIGSSIEKFYQLYEKSANEVNAMGKIAAAQTNRPEQIFEQRISSQFGKPTRTISSNNLDLKLYQFSDSNYTGYALKVNLKSGSAMKMVLGQDKVGGSETTLDAAKRYGAVAGINAGGFADDGGKRYPLSTTVYNGKYVYGFEPTFDDLSFIGISKNRKLIGGKFRQQEDLDKLNPEFGSTFVPILLKGGTKQQIPSQWLNSPRRAPRTVVGNFGNDQLLFIVTDGFDERGGSGATLPEMQDLLSRMRIRDAYNLDGGGSSSLVVEGKIMNKPSDGRLRRLPTHFLFFK